ncbi:MAG: hypothetical protein ABIL25_05645 [candidate division WOR-3 bacterium]
MKRQKPVSPCLAALLGAVLLALPCCFNRAVLVPVEEAEDTVEDFMEAMMDDDEEDMKDLISPAWLAKHKLDIEDYNVNAYTPEEYEIIGPDGKDIKVRLVFGSGATRFLWFRVVNEDDDYYIVPGSYDDELIHPWQKTEEGPEQGD